MMSYWFSQLKSGLSLPTVCFNTAPIAPINIFLLSAKELNKLLLVNMHMCRYKRHELWTYYLEGCTLHCRATSSCLNSLRYVCNSKHSHFTWMSNLLDYWQVWQRTVHLASSLVPRPLPTSPLVLLETARQASESNWRSTLRHLLVQKCISMTTRFKFAHCTTVQINHWACIF